MTEWSTCPKCGALMVIYTGYTQCPLCGYKVPVQTITTTTGTSVEYVPVRHGMWLPKHHYIAGYEFVSGHICSECGNDALNAEGDDFLTDFCPHCGARMDAE